MTIDQAVQTLLEAAAVMVLIISTIAIAASGREDWRRARGKRLEAARTVQEDAELRLALRDAGMRLDALRASVRELQQTVLRLRTALVEIDRYNGVNNDLDAYLAEVAKWGLGEIEEKPDRQSYGVQQ